MCAPRAIPALMDGCCLPLLLSGQCPTSMSGTGNQNRSPQHPCCCPVRPAGGGSAIFLVRTEWWTPTSAQITSLRRTRLSAWNAGSLPARCGENSWENCGLRLATRRRWIAPAQLARATSGSPTLPAYRGVKPAGLTWLSFESRGTDHQRNRTPAGTAPAAPNFLNDL